MSLFLQKIMLIWVILNIKDKSISGVFKYFGIENPDFFDTYSKILQLYTEQKKKFANSEYDIKEWDAIFEGHNRYCDFGFINRYIDPNGNPQDQPIIIEYLGYGLNNRLHPDYIVKKLITYSILRQLGIPVVLVCEPDVMEDYIKYLPVGTLLITRTEWNNIVSLAPKKYKGNIIAAMFDYNPSKNLYLKFKGGLQYAQLLKLSTKLTVGQLFANSFFYDYQNSATVSIMPDIIRNRQRLIDSFRAAL